MNFLGLEIRETLVDRANLLREQTELENVSFLYCNVNVALEEILDKVKGIELGMITIMFPDPHFKTRVWKRRMVKPKLVEQLAKSMRRGGRVFLQSDVLGVAQEMMDVFDGRVEFEKMGEEEWLEDNPFEVPTEREKLVLGKGDPVYRVMFRRV